MNGPGGHPIIHGTGLHETTVDNEWQGAATSVAYKRTRGFFITWGFRNRNPALLGKHKIPAWAFAAHAGSFRIRRDPTGITRSQPLRGNYRMAPTNRNAGSNPDQGREHGRHPGKCSIEHGT